MGGEWGVSGGCGVGWGGVRAPPCGLQTTRRLVSAASIHSHRERSAALHCIVVCRTNLSVNHAVMCELVFFPSLSICVL